MEASGETLSINILYAIQWLADVQNLAELKFRRNGELQGRRDVDEEGTDHPALVSGNGQFQAIAPIGTILS